MQAKLPMSTCICRLDGIQDLHTKGKQATFFGGARACWTNEAVKVKSSLRSADVAELYGNVPLQKQQLLLALKADLPGKGLSSKRTINHLRSARGSELMCKDQIVQTWCV